MGERHNVQPWLSMQTDLQVMNHLLDLIFEHDRRVLIKALNPSALETLPSPSAVLQDQAIVESYRSA